MSAPYAVGDELEMGGGAVAWRAVIVEERPGERYRWRLVTNGGPGGWWSTAELDATWRRRGADEGKSGCEAGPVIEGDVKIFWDAAEGAVWIARQDAADIEDARKRGAGLVVAIEPLHLDRLIEGLRKARQWYGEGPKTDSPSPDPYQVGVAVTIAAMALGVRLDRISYGTVVENGRTVFLLAVDGRHLLPSEVVEVEAAARAVGVT